MTHRKFLLKTKRDGHLFGERPVFLYDKRGRWIKPSPDKYFPPREWRLRILKRCAELELLAENNYYKVTLNWHGGFQNDKHITWLKEKGFITIHKGQRGNQIGSHDITYLYIKLTNAGRQYLERYEK